MGMEDTAHLYSLIPFNGFKFPICNNIIQHLLFYAKYKDYFI